jgi:hypothetical protein
MFNYFNQTLSSAGPQLGSVLGLGFLFAAIWLFVVLFFLGVYVYTALTWMTIARKLKYKRPWLAWIPVANLAMILQLGGFGWGWVFLILVPFLGWIALFILSIIATWRVFEKRKYPGWFSLAVLVPKVGGILYLVALGFVAWKDQKGKRK